MGTLKKRHMGRHLARGLCGEPNERIRGSCGPQKNLAAGRKMIRRTGVARRKVHVVRKYQTRDKAGREHLKRRTFWRRRQAKSKRKIVIEDRGLRQQLRSKREFARIYRKTIGLEIAKLIVGVFCRVTKNQEVDIVEGWASPKNGKRASSRFRRKRSRKWGITGHSV
jgi:hypothetical protein